MDIEEKINKIHDFTIRMEPVIDEVERIRKWKDGNGIPGARTQLWVLWGIFIIASAILIRTKFY